MQIKNSNIYDYQQPDYCGSAQQLNDGMRMNMFQKGALNGSGNQISRCEQMYAFQELGNDQGGLNGQRSDQAIQFHPGKANDYSTPQKLTNSKFMDELAEQEFEIQTFQVENGQS